MHKIKWIFIEIGYFLLKYSLRYRIAGEQQQWLQAVPDRIPEKRVDFIFRHCKGKKVLHIGFADAPFTLERIRTGQLLHLHLKSIAAELYGIDSNKNAVSLYRSMTQDEHISDVSAESLPQELLHSFDIILLGEILEHVKDPHGLIEKLQASLRAGQRLLVTVPNYVSADNIAAALHKKESVHADHYWYFSPYTLGKIFDSEKWIRKDFAYVFYGDKAPNFIQRKYSHLSDGLAALYELK